MQSGTNATETENRRFLMLQGPHGPFFSRLATLLAAAGAQVWRVGFNAGDAFFWPDRETFLPFTAPPEAWPSALGEMLERLAITDIVLYGDTRPHHAEAVRQARVAGLGIHVFEEGYLRPYWVTYERGGSNGNSRLMQTEVAAMRVALDRSGLDQPETPSHWGDMRQHVFYGALYHFFVMFRNGAFPGYRPHRAETVAQEFRLHLRRLLLMPAHALERQIATRRIRRGGFPYHLALLQLDHDASFLAHGPFASNTAFVAAVTAAFRGGAPRHHHLVFKAHPLDDGRTDLRRVIARAAGDEGLAGRVHFVRGGKLARLMAEARSAVTVNSTAAQQALWHGLPVRALGRAVYGKPEFVSSQPLADFFARPMRPDSRAYRDYRHYLLETSQVAGGFYSARGRRLLLRQVADMILHPQDPYDALLAGNAAPRQQLRLVR